MIRGDALVPFLCEVSRPLNRTLVAWFPNPPFEILAENKVLAGYAKVFWDRSGFWQPGGDHTVVLVPIYYVPPYGIPGDDVHPSGSLMVDICALSPERPYSALLNGVGLFLGQHFFERANDGVRTSIIDDPLQWLKDGGYGICPLTDEAWRCLARDTRKICLLAKDKSSEPALRARMDQFKTPGPVITYREVD